MFSAPCRLPENLATVALSKFEFDVTCNLLKRMVGLEGFEPPTHGLGNTRTTVHPVRTHDFSVGYSGAYSDIMPQLGHEYAPHYAPRPKPKNPTTNGFSSVADCLRFNAPRIGTSKRRLKQLESILLVRENRENHQQQLAFHARPFVLCGLPLRRPPKSQSVHARHSGKFFLQVTAHPDYGLPFGQDRLIPIWVATLALQQKSRTIQFVSAAQMLDFFHLPKDGPHYRRLVGGFQRIFAATIFFGTDEKPNGARLIDFSRFHFFDRMRLWFNPNSNGPDASPEVNENVITLSEAFHQEIDQHRIPVEREAISCFAHARGTLDFYIWLVWRSWTLNGTQARIPLLSPDGLARQLGASAYSADRFFRRKIRYWLRQVKVVWPECPAAISTDGQDLLVSSSRTSPAISTCRRPKMATASSC